LPSGGGSKSADSAGTNERAAEAEQEIELPAHSPTTYVLPTAILMLGAMLQVVSMLLPFWQLTLHAPQYPQGLTAKLYVNRLAGDVSEINGLNHYIGMPKLEEAATFERSFAVIAIITLACLLIGATFIFNRGAAAFALPAILYPIIFLADLYYWLRRFGHDLDPTAALSSSIKPFTPTMIGDGTIGQFSTTGSLQSGFYLAALGSLVILVGLYFHRRAYKPLVEAQQRAERAVE
jgi:hypothetical protein